jgi:8-oxo-dGTP pyrophosphatase MutT (NUDIX family)
MIDKKFTIRCRGIIVHGGKLLVVQHRAESKWFALPGGHLEFGEGIKEALEREIIEELGIKPVIGRLLYINTFIDKGDTQPVEFFFEIINSTDYLDTSVFNGTHRYELFAIKWVSPSDDTTIFPSQLAEDLKSGSLLSDKTRFIQG